MWGNSTKIFNTKYYFSVYDFVHFISHFNKPSIDFLIDKKNKKVLLCYHFGKHINAYFQMHLRSFYEVFKELCFDVRFREVKFIVYHDFCWRYK